MTSARPRRTAPALLAAAGVALIAAGCASAPQQMVYQGGSEAGNGRVWPAGPSGEVPRYRYVGELTGETNFRSEGDPGAGSLLQRAFEIIVGLAEKIVAPTVLQRPQGGYTDDSGRVYVTDVSRKAVFVFDPAAGRLLVWDEPAPGERFGTPVALAPGRAGELLVTDSDRGEVFRLATDGRPTGRFGKGVLGRPTGVARDPAAGRVYVGDVQHRTVHVFDDDGRAVGTLGDPADGATLNAPVHLAFASGMLYVVDGLEARVVVLGEDGKLRATIGKRGLYVGNLVRPKGVAVDDEGNVYVVESMYDRLLVFDAEGRLLLAIGGTGRDIGRFYLPAGVWVDARNRVYVADMFNGRVVVFQFLGGS